MYAVIIRHIIVSVAKLRFVRRPRSGKRRGGFRTRIIQLNFHKYVRIDPHHALNCAHLLNCLFGNQVFMHHIVFVVKIAAAIDLICGEPFRFMFIAQRRCGFHRHEKHCRTEQGSERNGQHTLCRRNAARFFPCNMQPARQRLMQSGLKNDQPHQNDSEQPAKHGEPHLFERDINKNFRAVFEQRRAKQQPCAARAE